MSKHAASSVTITHLDIGGEGRHLGFWNLNPRHTKTLGKNKGQPIPRHLAGRADAIPLPAASVSVVVVERTPLTRWAIFEIARVVKKDGIVVLRHVKVSGRDCHALEKSILRGRVRERLTRIGNQQVVETLIRLSGY